MNRYEKLVELASECDSLELEKSIVLTDLILYKKDTVEIAILLLEIIKKLELENKQQESEIKDYRERLGLRV